MRTLFFPKSVPFVAALVVAAVSLACQRGGDPVEIGRSAYNANCIACHNPDPTLEGTQGPAIAGSASELIEARVLRAEYPPGYTPKRTSSLMPAQPYLKDAVPYLAAYLESIPAK